SRHGAGRSLVAREPRGCQGHQGGVMTKRFPATVAAALTAVAALATQAQPQATVREITKLAGEVYRFRNNNHYSMFEVTPAVELAYVGRNHSDNSIVIRFPKERLLFAVDFIPVESLAFRDFPDAYIQDWIDSLQRVEAMDFDVLVPGHGPLGRKEHVRMFREYMEELRDEVLRHAREGKSVD